MNHVCLQSRPSSTITLLDPGPVDKFFFFLFRLGTPKSSPPIQSLSNLSITIHSNNMPCRHFPQSPTAIIRSLSCHPITFSCETCSVDPVTQTISKSVPNSIAYLHTAIKQLLFYTPTTMPEQLQSCNKNIKNLIIDLERFPRISQLEFFCNTSTIHPFLGYFFVICSYRKKYNPLLTSTIVSHCREALMNAPNSGCLLFFPIKQPPITCIQFLSTTCQLEVIAIHPSTFSSSSHPPWFASNYLCLRLH